MVSRLVLLHMNSATLWPMSPWLLRHRRVVSALLAVAMLSTLPLAHAMVGVSEPMPATSEDMPCHHFNAVTIATKHIQHGCCQDSQSCLQHCLAGLIVTSGVPTQPQLIVTPVRRTQIISQADKFLFSITQLPEFDPPR